MGVLEVLRQRRFRWLAAARTAGYLGNAIAPIALAFAVLDLTGSVTDLGIVVGTRSVANVALLLVGGVLADRLPRAVLLQGASLAAALTAGGLATAVLGGFASVPLLAGVGLVNGAVSAMSLPAAAAITPETVPAGVLQQANAVVRMGTNTASVAGSASGGLLAALTGPGWAMAVTAVIFLAEAGCYLRVGRGDRPAARSRVRPLAELREGWSEFVSRTWVWVVVVQFMVVNAAVVGGLHVLGPAIADDTIGRTAWGFALAAETAGALAGGVLAARWLPRRALGFGVALTSVIAVPLLLLAHGPSVVVMLVVMFAAGVGLEQFTIAWDLSLQQNVPGDRLARVYSYDMVGSFVAVPIGQLVAGPVAVAVGTSATLTGAAVLIVVATAAALLSQEVRTLRRRSEVAEPAP